MTTALATQDRNTALTTFGDEAARKSMLPVLAEAINIPASEANAAHNQGVLLKATAWMQTFGAVPGVHFECVKRYDSREQRDTYPLIAKYEWAVHNLAQYNRTNPSQNLQVIYRTATPEEVQEIYASLTQSWDEYRYDKRDPGTWAALVDMKLGPAAIKEYMEMEKSTGIQIFQWHFGTYRHQTYNKYKKQWQAENLPATDTPARVAQRRAAKKAINAMIPKAPIIHREDSRYTYALTTMQGSYEEAHRQPSRAETAMLYRPEVTMDEDGFIVDTPRVVVTPAQQHTDTAAQEPAVVVQAEEIPFVDPLDILELEDIQPDFAAWVQALRETNRKEEGDMSGKAYATLAKTVKTWVGGEHWQKVDADELFSALLAKTICIEALPNHLAGNMIFTAVMTERAKRDASGRFVKEEGKPVYEPNPDFNRMVIDGLTWVHEKVKPLPF